LIGSETFMPLTTFASHQPGSPPLDPRERSAPWPTPVVVGLGLAGVISPLLCFAGAVVVYAFADRDQGRVLAGVGLAHVLLGLTVLAGT
jgi:hypothetical protein